MKSLVDHTEAGGGESGNECELFFEFSVDPMGIVGTDGFFKRVNPAFERFLGLSQAEICTRPLVDFMHPDDASRTREGIRILAGGTSRLGTTNRYRRADGVYRWFSWNTRPVGALLYSIGRDVTEQVEAEERIRVLNEELQAKNRDLERKVEERVAELRRTEDQMLQLQKMDAIGRLAGGVAHDFNNMLGAISMYSDLLADDAERPEAVRAHVEEVRHVTARAAALSRQLLVFSRKQVVQPQVLNLTSLIEHLEKMLVRLIGENVRIVLKLAGDLRPVMADPSQLEQVLLNLVVNARDAMPGGGAITISARNADLDQEFSTTHLTVTPGPYVLLSVADEGIGMDAATREKLFEPFFTTKPIGKGTGLGLSTVYGIVKQSGGTIWVYSEPGKGSVFNIYLPVCRHAVAEPPASPEPAPPAADDRTILLVEDDERLRNSFSAMLRRRGYRVLEAANGRVALEICERDGENVHLLLTDVVMPDMNGFALAKQVHERLRNLPVLFMSGYTSETVESAGIENPGALDFLQKPFDTNSLVRKVHEVLAKRGSRA